MLAYARKLIGRRRLRNMGREYNVDIIFNRGVGFIPYDQSLLPTGSEIGAFPDERVVVIPESYNIVEALNSLFHEMGHKFAAILLVTGINCK